LENLDEIIFYIRSTAKFCDVIGFLIFACHGIWSLKTGTINWIGLPFFILLCCEKVGKRLYNALKKHLQKDAMKKLNAIKTTTKEQSQGYGDVCSKCIRQMSLLKSLTVEMFFMRRV
jgi:hypothetical protein